MKPQTTAILISAFAAMLSAANPVFAAVRPDSTLATTYSMNSNLSAVSWVTCGALPGSSGCYQSGSLGSFGKVGAVLESDPTFQGNVVTRHIYVLDSASGAASNGVTLYDYKRVDTILTASITTTISRPRTLALPLSGGSAARPAMAAGGHFLYIATNLGTNVVQVQKSNLAQTSIEITNVGGVAAIRSNSYGWVTVTGGSNSGLSDFGLFDPNGRMQESGGGAQVAVDTRNALIPADLPLYP